MDEAKLETVPLLEEAEEIIILNQYKKESIVFQVTESTFLAFLVTLPEMLLGWQQELRYASKRLKVLIATYCPLIGEDLLAELLRDGYASALRANPHIPDQLQTSLRIAARSDPKTLVRFAVARDPQASLEDLEILAHDPRPITLSIFG